MSDERSQSPPVDGNGSADGSTDIEPGGGPQRVVSEESVDDILDSLAETKSGGADGATPSSDTAGGTAAGAGTAVTTAADEDETEGTENAGAPVETESADDGTASDPDPDALAARVERGDVTGADVRAAEAGDGRDPTPEVDEIDLSMDDLETTESAADPDGVPDDAGPLAGSVETDSEPDDSNADDEDETGLLGRIKRFFSR
ncbi:hypothetical protein [Halopiger djelfimassiliensis]|uniref:hypothetical protein n=1 Tax=Halopiger djelfimassiliensis TaxID=1293047 RepID=UPI0006779C32|nr:hypothetical protein [Halopiger djelfimassiliensis]